MIKIKKFEFNIFGEATYLVWDTDTSEAMVIDPGMNIAAERELFDRFVADHGLKLTQMVNTHLHLDHIWGNAHIKGTYGLPVQANEADAFLGERAREQARMFGQDPQTIGSVAIDRNLVQGDTVKVGTLTFEVLQVPGHSPGSIALYDAGDHVVFTGDALFAGSIGRTDLPGGSHRELVASIRNRLLTLPADTVVYPGHGPSTTIGREKADNPYL